MRAREGTGLPLSLRRRGLVGLAATGAGIAVLALASVAGAATVGFQTDPPVCGVPLQCPPRINYTASAGEANNLTVSRNASTNDTTFTEVGGVTLSARSGVGTCTPLSSHAVRCHPGDAGIDIALGDQNDGVQLSGSLGPNCGQSNFVGACVQVVGGSGLDFVDASGTTGDGVFGHGLNLLGGDGTDTLIGGAGGDLLVGGGGADTMSGGSGIDRASYADHAGGVVATLDGARNDGTPGVDGGTTTGADQIDTDVEQLQGGKGNDHLVGNGGNNLLVGGAGSDQLEGLSGNDFIDSNDGIADTVLCGVGTDKARVDLKDGPAGFRDCESVSQAAVDQHPAVEIRSRLLRLNRGHDGRDLVRVRMRCPHALHRGCRGRLAILRLTGDGKDPAFAHRPAVIGRTRYPKIAAGSSRRLKVRIKPGGAQAARRHGHISVRVKARELDANGMPKLSLRTMRLRG